MMTAPYPPASLSFNHFLFFLDRQDLSACCNAISIALMDAGIPLKSILTSVDVIILKDGTMIVDPTKDAQKNAACLTSFQISNDQILTEWSHVLPNQDTPKSLDLSKYLLARKLAVNASSEIHDFINREISLKCKVECRGTAF